MFQTVVNHLVVINSNPKLGTYFFEKNNGKLLLTFEMFSVPRNSSEKKKIVTISFLFLVDLFGINKWKIPITLLLLIDPDSIIKNN